MQTNTNELIIMCVLAEINLDNKFAFFVGNNWEVIV